MGKAKRPQQVKLVIGMLAKDKKLFDYVEEFFTKRFGGIDYKSLVLSFGHTNYYEKELGAPLKRKFLSFKKLVKPESIAEVKIATNTLEKKFSILKNEPPNRQINIDPGYISASKFVLVTTKDYYHRIYLNKGIYAEVTLRWKKSGFLPFEWTYPDYKTQAYTEILTTIRNNYMNQLKSHAG